MPLPRPRTPSDRRQHHPPTAAVLAHAWASLPSEPGAAPPTAEPMKSPPPTPRVVVMSLSAEAFDAQSLYEKNYGARGEIENRIKEQQLCLFANRTSAATMRPTSCVCGSLASPTR